MNIYQRIGVPTIINAAGPSTRLSGGIMRPEVAEAMAAASRHCIDMTQLQAAASATIARVTGAEAGCVTAGAAAALMLGAAACMTGLDPVKMNQLPYTEELGNEIVIARSQRNFYDRALRQAGARLVEVGIPDRFSGAGVRDAEPWELEAAIGPRTVALFWMAQRNSEPPLADIVRIAHKHGLPVLVDAAGQMPPASNLRRFIEEGADLVAISGGKAIGGPQASGMLAGRRDLVQAALLQMLDQDVFFDQWDPPPALFDKHLLPGLPHNGIGRVGKVGKEEIVGLMAALDAYVAESEEIRGGRWRALCEELAAGLTDLRYATATVRADVRRPGLWNVELALEEAALRLTAHVLLGKLQASIPAIHAGHGKARDGIVMFSPMCIEAKDPPIIAHRVREILAEV